MFGWEFPPLITGGLGTACQGLVKGLNDLGVDVRFVVPSSRKEAAAVLPDAGEEPEGNGVPRGLFQLTPVPSVLRPYARPAGEQGDKNGLLLHGDRGTELYGGDLLQAVEMLKERAREIASTESFDIIHAHDWMTFPAGIAAREESGRPLAVHLHSTEYDRCLEHVWPPVCRLERAGLHAADRVIAVSARSKWQIVDKYDVPQDNITVIHNGLNLDHLGGAADAEPVPLPPRPEGKMVLFLGRVTPQKGPGFFIEAAAQVLKTEKNAVFVVAGSGDMIPALIERAAELGISQKVLFTGFLEGPQVRWAFETADVYVMPSVSDPFGISCLEAMYSGTPVVLSNQTGIAEVVDNVHKVNHWDVEGIADSVVRLLRDPHYARELASRGAAEARRITWRHPASRCITVYKDILAEAQMRPHGD